MYLEYANPTPSGERLDEEYPSGWQNTWRALLLLSKKQLNRHKVGHLKYDISVTETTHLQIIQDSHTRETETL